MSGAGSAGAPRQVGALVLVATPIGNLGDLSPRAVEALASADVVACEDTRHTGRLLVHAGVRARRLVSLHEHNEAARLDELLGAMASGATVALVSDAGTPLVSDPGERLVAAAIAAGVEVTAVPGPSAALAALVLSGLGTARWRYEGFLPRKGAERRERLVEIAASPEPVVCYESPRRVAATLSDLAEACGAERKVAVARELTKLHEEVWRGPLGEAAARAAAAEPRGEHVIVVAGAVPAARPSGEALTGALERLIAAGLGRREAVLAVEVLLGVARREAYQAALALGPLEKATPGPS